MRQKPCVNIYAQATKILRVSCRSNEIHMPTDSSICPSSSGYLQPSSEHCAFLCSQVSRAVCPRRVMHKTSLMEGNALIDLLDSVTNRRPLPFLGGLVMAITGNSIWLIPKNLTVGLCLQFSFERANWFGFVFPVQATSCIDRLAVLCNMFYVLF